MNSLRRAMWVVVGCGGLLATSITKADLIGYWSFDEGTGTTAGDAVGPTFSNGTLSGTVIPTWVPGRSGAAGDFALNFFGGTWATGSHVAIPNNAELQVTGDQTIMMWLRPSATIQSDVGAGRQNPWNKAYGGEGTMTIEPGGGIHYFHGTAGANSLPYQSVYSLSGGQTVAPGPAWTHITLTRDMEPVAANGRVRWYFNGVLGANVATSYTAATASTLPQWIGTGYTYGFQGIIDEVALWNEPLSVGKINSIYKMDDPANPLGEFGLGYDIDDMADLFAIFDGGNGSSGVVEGEEWLYIENLDVSGRTLGDAWLTGGAYFLWLDALNNAGLFNPPPPPLAPEPGTFVLFGAVLSIAGLAYYRKRSTGR